MTPPAKSSPHRISYLLAPLLTMGLILASLAQSKAPTGGKPVRTDRYGDPLPPGAIARLGTVRFRDSGTVYSVSYSPDGKILAAIGGCGVRLWDAATGKPLHHYTGLDASKDESFPYATYDRGFFAPDGRRLWLQAADSRNPLEKELYFWNLTPKPERRPRKAPFAGRDLALLAASPDGKSLAIGDRDGIRICDISTGKESQRFSGGGRVFFSADGKVLACLSLGSIVLWDVKSGEQIRFFRARGRGNRRRASFTNFALAPNGKTVAAFFRGQGASIILWDAATGQELRRLQVIEPAASAMIFSPDSKVLAVAGKQWLRAWDVSAGKMLWEQHAFFYGYFSLAFSPDGKTLAAGLTGEVLRYDAATGKELPPVPDGDRIAFVTLLADGRTAATAGSGEPLRLWRLPEATEILPAPGRKRLVVPEVADVSRDGKWMASRNHGDGAIRIWDIASGKVVHRLPHISSPACSFSPDGKWLQTHNIEPDPNTRQNGSVLRFWDAATGKMMSELRGHRAGVAVFSPDSRTFVPGGVNSSISLGRVPDGSLLRTIAGGVRRLSFSPDGRLLVGGDWCDKPPHLWETASGKEINPPRRTARRQIGSSIYEVAFSPDGRHLFTSDGSGRLFFWNLEGRLIHQWQGDDFPVFVLRFTPDGKRLLSGGKSTVLLWNLEEVLPAQKRKPTPLTDAELKSLWADLQSEDATRGYRAVWKLADAPEQAVPFLRQHLRPARQPDKSNTARILQWIRDLDSDTFKLRDTASRELATLGREAEPALRKALQSGPSLEQKRRIEDLLRKMPDSLPPPSPEQLRMLRAVAVLEYAATDAARELLKELSQGHAEAGLTREAGESLTRLVRRAAKP